MKELHNHRPISISTVGDISFEGSLSATPDLAVFAEVTEQLAAADLCIANLENPLTLRGQKVIGKCTLRGVPGWADILRQSGIGLVSLANNHMMDYGPEGLSDTIRALDSAGIRHVGAGRNKTEALAPVFLRINDKTFAILARSSVIVSSPSYATDDMAGVAFLDPGELTNAVKKCKEEADIVVAYLHWGLEEYNYPSPDQTALAKRVVTAGADIIIGHHPHVLQGLQRIGSSIVAYSLGNFLFGEFTWNGGENGNAIRFALSESNRKGMILHLFLTKDKKISPSPVFTRIEADGRISIDASNKRHGEFRLFSKKIDGYLYKAWWQGYAVRKEWHLRLKHTFSLHRLINNFTKIRPRHFLEVYNSLRKSLNIARNKSTNPYD